MPGCNRRFVQVHLCAPACTTCCAEQLVDECPQVQGHTSTGCFAPLPRGRGSCRSLHKSKIATGLRRVAACRRMSPLPCSLGGAGERSAAQQVVQAGAHKSTWTGQRSLPKSYRYQKAIATKRLSLPKGYRDEKAAIFNRSPYGVGSFTSNAGWGKTKRSLTRAQSSRFMGERRGSNPRVMESQSIALPLGYARHKIKLYNLYITKFF